jgi:hypothetical protein
MAPVVEAGMWDEEGRHPPIVLRATSGSLSNEAVPSPMEKLSLGLLGAVASVLEAPLSLGASLLYTPLALSGGVYQAGRAADCASRWNATFGDVPAWFTKTFSGVSILGLASEELSRLVVEPDGRVRVEVAKDMLSTTGARKQTGARLAASSVVVTEFRVTLRESERSHCGAKFEARASLVWLRLADGKVMEKRETGASDEVSEADVEAWAKDPGAARARLAGFMTTLAKHIVVAYASLAPDDATGAPKSDQDISAWCLVNPEAVEIWCGYPTYAACCLAKLTDGYRCVTQD